MLRMAIEFVLFATSTGVFFNEKLRGNYVAVGTAGLIAVASTISLFVTLNDFVRETSVGVPVLVPNPIGADEVFWLTIRESAVIGLFEEFVNKFPASKHMAEARARIAELKQNTARGSQSTFDRGVVIADPPSSKSSPQKICVIFNGRQICE